MRIRYFEDTDTLLIELRDAPASETRDLDENTVVDLDAQGNVCAITLEHASQRTPDGHPKLPHLWPGQTPPPEQVADAAKLRG